MQLLRAQMDSPLMEQTYTNWKIVVLMEELKMGRIDHLKEGPIKNVVIMEMAQIDIMKDS